MAIPRIIHVCWFGGASRDRNNLHCEASRSLLAQRGYEIRVWTESNYDVGKCRALTEAYKSAKWSLVSNYVRLDVLRQFGGIYLDTDVEVLRDFDDLLGNEFFIGFMWDCTLGTAVIGACPGHKIVCDILEGYEKFPSSLVSPNNNTFTEYFLSQVEGFLLTGRCQDIGQVLVLDKYAFEHPSFLRRKNYAVHHFSQSWVPTSPIKNIAKSYIKRIFSLWLYRKYICFRSKRISQFYPIYQEQLRMHVYEQRSKGS